MTIKMSDCPTHEPPWPKDRERRLMIAWNAGVELYLLVDRFGHNCSYLTTKLDAMRKAGMPVAQRDFGKPRRG